MQQPKVVILTVCKLYSSLLFGGLLGVDLSIVTDLRVRMYGVGFMEIL